MFFSTENSFDLHAECENIKVDVTSRQSWLPIDVNYILPVHETYNTIPGLFDGFDNQKTNKGKVRKKIKKKKAKIVSKNPQ